MFDEITAPASKHAKKSAQQVIQHYCLTAVTSDTATVFPPVSTKAP